LGPAGLSILMPVVKEVATVDRAIDDALSHLLFFAGAFLRGRRLLRP
jgi:hypothetical protein